MSACRSSVGRPFHSFGPAAAKHMSFSIVAVCSSHDARPWCGRTQLTAIFVRDQLTVGGQIGWSHAGQWQVDQGGQWPSCNPPDVELEASAAPVAHDRCQGAYPLVGVQCVHIFMHFCISHEWCSLKFCFYCFIVGYKSNNYHVCFAAI